MLLTVIWAAKSGYHALQDYDPKSTDSKKSAVVDPNNPAMLPGLPPNLEPLLEAARKQGPKVFRRWLDYYGAQIEDPRKAWIELDYVIDISRENMDQARQIFESVKARTPKNGPVYERIKKLAPGYE